MSLASDVALMLQYAPDSVTVAYNGVSAPGILSRSSDYASSGGEMSVEVRSRTLTVQNGVFRDLRVDGRIVIGGVPYVIREFDDEGADDGAILRIPVTRARSS